MVLNDMYVKIRDKKRYCIYLFRQIKRYTENPESLLYFNYGGKGIKCHFTSYREILHLFKRDTAINMRTPYLARKVAENGYSRENCYFIEFDTVICEEYRNKIDQRRWTKGAKNMGSLKYN